MEFKKFNQDALDAYLTWVKENHEVILLSEDPPEVPCFANLLAGRPDAIMKNPNGGAWPVLVKKVWQPQCGKVRSFEEIASKSSSYLEQEKGKWKVKPFTAVYYACQNIMMLYGFENMDLICYSEPNDKVLVVGVTLDKLDYNANMESLKDFLQRGLDKRY